MSESILNDGFSSEGQDVRPRWEDGTPAHTIKKFGVVNRYNLAENFPFSLLEKYLLREQLMKYFGYGRKIKQYKGFKQSYLGCLG